MNTAKLKSTEQHVYIDDRITHIIDDVGYKLTYVPFTVSEIAASKNGNLMHAPRYVRNSNLIFKKNR